MKREPFYPVPFSQLSQLTWGLHTGISGGWGLPATFDTVLFLEKRGTDVAADYIAVGR